MHRGSDPVTIGCRCDGVLWQGRRMSLGGGALRALDDLEQQAEALYDAERAAELADRSRAEYHAGHARQPADGLGRRRGGARRARRRPGRRRLERVGAGWCLLRGPAQDWVVPLAAVAAVPGASDRAVPEVAWPAVRRLGLGSALRRLAEAGERCVVHLRRRRPPRGGVRRVGADFVEVDGGRPARWSWSRFDALAAVQSRD